MVRTRDGVVPGLPRRHGVSRPADDVVGDRYRRHRPRGESARADDGARVVGAGARSCDSRPGAAGPDADVRGRAGDAQRIDEPRDVRRLRLRVEGVELPAARSRRRRANRRRVPSSRSTIRGRCSPAPRIPTRSGFSRLSASLKATPLKSSPKPNARSATATARPRQGGTPHTLRQRVARQEADCQSAVSARGASHEGRRLQRAHGAVRGDGSRRRYSGAHRGRPRLRAGRPGRLLLPRVARGLLDEGEGRGLWLPVDPTLNQFPADGTHLRLVRGGLDQQAAILPLIGRLRMTVLDHGARSPFHAHSRRAASRRSCRCLRRDVLVPRAAARAGAVTNDCRRRALSSNTVRSRPSTTSASEWSREKFTGSWDRTAPERRRRSR